MSVRNRFLNVTVAALMAFAWNSTLISDSALAAPRKVKHQSKPKQKLIKKKKTKLVKKSPKSEINSSGPNTEALMGEVPAPLGAPPCPAAGNIGIHQASEWTIIISNNLARTIEICNDLEFSTPPEEITSGRSGLTPSGSDWMYGFQGTLEGNGHSIRMQSNASGSLFRGISLGFGEIVNGTIQNLTLEGLGDVPADAHPGYLVAGYATNATFRNIRLNNVVTAAGAVYSGRHSRFEGIAGNVILQPGLSQRISGGLAQTCDDCSITNSNLNVILDSTEGMTGPSYPTYAGALIGYVRTGSLTVRNTIVSGAMRRGYDRGMIAGALDGAPSSSPAADGSTSTPQLLIDGVRVVNADLTQLADVRSYTVGGLVGRASLPTTITRTLVRDSMIESNQQAGGLIGGAVNVVASEVALSGVRVRASGVAGGMIGWNSQQMQIEDSYFVGEVSQSGDLPFGASPLFAAGGILGFANQSDILRRVYVSARVTADGTQFAGALVGGDTSEFGFGTVTAENAFYDGSLAMQFYPLGTALTPQQMIQPVSFVGFGESEWSMQQGRLPLLKNRPLYLVQDLFDYLALYFSQDRRADRNMDGLISVEDLFQFLESYHTR